MRILAILLFVVVLVFPVAAQDETNPGFMLYGTLNPAAAENDFVFSADAALSADFVNITAVTGAAGLEGIGFDGAGNAYINVDLAIDESGAVTAGGVHIFDGFIVETTGERLIAGETTGIISPKGFQALETLGVFVIGDNGAKDIKLFALDADGDIAPAAVISIGEGGSIWDVWYDILNDTLYGAKTNGDLIAYDFFSETWGENGPDRIITPTDDEGNKISVNLHGLEVDYDSNTIIVSDVGDAGDATDGQIFVLHAVSISDGPTPVDARIYGPETMLGNPVDLIFDGSGIFVAEKANDVMLYYANVLELSGDVMVAADIVVAANKPEGVAIYPTREQKIIADMGLMDVE